MVPLTLVPSNIAPVSSSHLPSVRVRRLLSVQPAGAPTLAVMHVRAVTSDDGDANPRQLRPRAGVGPHSFVRASLAVAGGAPGSTSTEPAMSGGASCTGLRGVPRRVCATSSLASVEDVFASSTPEPPSFGVSAEAPPQWIGGSVVEWSTGYTVTARMRAASRRPRKEMAMATTERMTAPAADGASVLHHELRRRFSADGVIDLDERRLLQLSGAVTRSISEADEQLGVLLAGFRVNGLRSDHFRRRLRRWDRDFDPDPSGPAAMGNAADEGHRRAA